jgi:hypothetical protein
MARSLLLSTIVRVLLLAAASSMSACIIPVAPDFQDPPTQPDAPPAISNLNPPHFGLAFSITDKYDFSASVSDPDPGTTLSVRWTVDYPPYTANTWINNGTPVSPLAPNEPIVNRTVTQRIDCTSINDRSTSAHRLQLIVTDGAFVTPDPSQAYSLDQLDGSGTVVYAYWPINITCPQIPPP